MAGADSEETRDTMEVADSEETREDSGVVDSVHQALRPELTPRPRLSTREVAVSEVDFRAQLLELTLRPSPSTREEVVSVDSEDPALLPPRTPKPSPSTREAADSVDSEDFPAEPQVLAPTPRLLVDK